MSEMMEQMDVSDKTIHRMIEEGSLPDFTYGSKWSRKKGWHTAVLERHAMEKYELSQSLKNAGGVRNVAAEDMGVMFLGSSNTAVSHELRNLDDRDPSLKKLSSKKVAKRVRAKTRHSRIAAGF